jgi:hypothetical protein
MKVLQSSELGLPALSPAGERAPPPFGSGGGDTLACGRGAVPIPTRGQTLYFITLGKYVLCEVVLSE